MPEDGLTCRELSCKKPQLLLDSSNSLLPVHEISILATQFCLKSWELWLCIHNSCLNICLFKISHSHSVSALLPYRTKPRGSHARAQRVRPSADGYVGWCSYKRRGWAWSLGYTSDDMILLLGTFILQKCHATAKLSTSSGNLSRTWCLQPRDLQW